MRLLLDTHVVLSQLQGTRTLGPASNEAIEQASELMFSVVSFAEIGVKASIGKLVVPDGLDQHIVQSGLRILRLAPEHGLGVADLPLYHRDPFDRLLVAQARSEGLTVLSADIRIAEYDVPFLDAGV